MAVLAPGDEGHDLGFGKDRAHARDADRLLARLQGMGSKLFHRHPQGAGHVLQKAACTGGTTVVHFEPLDPSTWCHADDLAILAANVEHCAHVGIEMVCARAIGLDL